MDALRAKLDTRPGIDGRDQGILVPIPRNLTEDPQAPAQPTTPVQPVPESSESSDVSPESSDASPAPAPSILRPENQRGNQSAVTALAELTPQERTSAGTSAVNNGREPGKVILALRAIKGALAKGRPDSTPLYVKYWVAKAEAGSVNLTQREREQLERDAGERGEVLETKLIVPISDPVQSKAGDWTFTALDASKALDNASRILEWMSANPTLVPAGRNVDFTGRDDPRLLRAMIDYTRNQANGFLGNGEPFPAGFRDGIVETPGYVPVAIPDNVRIFLNAVMGNTPPGSRTSKAVAAGRLAEAAGGTVSSFGEFDGVETNPLRAAIRNSGIDIDKVLGALSDGTSRDRNSATSVFRIDRIDSIEATRDNGLRPPNATAISAGFMPAGDDARYMPAPEDFKPVTGAQTEKLPVLRKIEQDYTTAKGLAFRPHENLAPLNAQLATRIADIFDQSPDRVTEMQADYEALAQETLEQYRELEAAGFDYVGSTEGYANSGEMVRDLGENKRLRTFPTEAGFGSGDVVSTNPLLRESGVVVDGKNLLFNDVFRFVHDIFGHAKSGYQFGPRGELNAYLAHSRMFTPAARRALASETLAQNSWVNFGPHLRKPDGTLPAKGEPGYVPPAARPFADQKSVVIPDSILRQVDALVDVKFMPAQSTPDRVSRDETDPATRKIKFSDAGLSAVNDSLLRVQKLPVADEDGDTFNIDGTKYSGGGLVVPVASTNFDDRAKVSPDSLEEFASAHEAKIGPGVKIGIYKFPNSESMSADVSLVVSPEKRSLALRVGAALGQESMFDLGDFTNVKTGAAGSHPLSLTDDQFAEIAQALDAGRFPLATLEAAHAAQPETSAAIRAQLGRDPFAVPVSAFMTPSYRSDDNSGAFDGTNPDIRYMPADKSATVPLYASPRKKHRVGRPTVRYTRNGQGEPAFELQAKRIYDTDTDPLDTKSLEDDYERDMEIAKAGYLGFSKGDTVEVFRPFSSQNEYYSLKRDREAAKIIRKATTPDGTLKHTVSGKGDTIRVTHWTKKGGLKKVDPAFMKPRPGTDQRMYAGIPKSFYFLEGSRPLKAENFGGSGLPFQYDANLPTNRIYDMDRDPLDVWGAINPSVSEQILKDAGYVGFYAVSDGREFVASFYPLPVTKSTVAKTDGDARFMAAPSPEELPPFSGVNILGRRPGAVSADGGRENPEVGALLKQAALDYWGVKIESTNITPEQESKLVQMALAEVLDALSKSGNAADWYTTAVKRALTVAGVLHPEIASDAAARAAGFPDAKAALLGLAMAMAITSQNLSVKQNTQYANEQFEVLKRTGKFDPTREYGEKATSISANLRLANILIAEYGWERAETMISADYKVRDLAKELTALLGAKKKATVAGRASDTVQGAAIFGPKIGQGFLQNLRGNFTPVTVDLWLRRTWGRWTGDVVGEGPTPAQIARVIDSSRATKTALPEVLRSVRTVPTKKGRKENTLTQAAYDRIHDSPEAVQEVMAFAKSRVADWTQVYKRLRDPMTPDEKAALLDGSVALESHVRKIRPYLAEREAAWDRANTAKSAAWERAVADAKGAKKKTSPRNAFFAAYDAVNGRTETLSNKQLSDLRPEWASAVLIIEKSLNPIDAPTDQDREVITRIVSAVAAELKELGMTTTNADIQAILWYPEKDIWAILRGEQESNLKSSYDLEFFTLAEQQGLGAEARDALERAGAGDVPGADGAARDRRGADARPAGRVSGPADGDRGGAEDLVRPAPRVNPDVEVRPARSGR